MTEARAALIARVWAWDKAAVERSLPPETRRGIWRVLDALYADMAVFRTPGYLDMVRQFLASLEQNAQVQAVREELGL